MTRKEHEIRRSILRKIRLRLELVQDDAQKAFLLGLEAGELMKGSGKATLNALQTNFEQARSVGVCIDPDLLAHPDTTHETSHHAATTAKRK